jgi:hypothetical protein
MQPERAIPSTRRRRPQSRCRAPPRRKARLFPAGGAAIAVAVHGGLTRRAAPALAAVAVGLLAMIFHESGAKRPRP